MLCVKTVRAIIEYQPSEKRPRGRPRKRWFDRVSQDFRALEVKGWREIIQDRERKKALTVAAKTLRES